MASCGREGQPRDAVPPAPQAAVFQQQLPRPPELSQLGGSRKGCSLHLEIQAQPLQGYSLPRALPAGQPRLGCAESPHLHCNARETMAWPHPPPSRPFGRRTWSSWPRASGCASGQYQGASRPRIPIGGWLPAPLFMVPPGEHRSPRLTHCPLSPPVPWEPQPRLDTQERFKSGRWPLQARGRPWRLLGEGEVLHFGVPPIGISAALGLEGWESDGGQGSCFRPCWARLPCLFQEDPIPALGPTGSRHPSLTQLRCSLAWGLPL